MRELLALDDLTEEQRAELDTLTNRAASLEVEFRAAVVAYPDPVEESGDDAEARELDGLVDQANIGHVFQAAVEHRATTGPEAELQQHYGLGHNQVPLSLLTGQALPVETRAVTPAPSNVGQPQQTIIPAVFPQAAASWLGISMPSVAVGEPVYPVLTTGADVKAPAESASVAETTGAFSATVLTPGRLQASFFYTREDRARFAGMAEALRQNLADALSDKMDEQILNGTFGLLSADKGDSKPVLADNDASAQATYASYRSLAYGRVDGTWATDVSDVRWLVGHETYAHMAAQFRSANAGDRAAIEDLMNVLGGLRVSAHIAGVSSKKQLSIMRLGLRMDAVAPVWEGVTLIPDEVTRAKTGEIVITAVMLYAFRVLRTNGFRKQQIQTAA